MLPMNKNDHRRCNRRHLPNRPVPSACGASVCSEVDIDKFTELGNLALHDIPTDHGDYVIEKSYDRLIHYMAGYVARKFVTRHDCVH